MQARRRFAWALSTRLSMRRSLNEVHARQTPVPCRVTASQPGSAAASRQVLPDRLRPPRCDRMRLASTSCADCGQATTLSPRKQPPKQPLADKPVAPVTSIFIVVLAAVCRIRCRAASAYRVLRSCRYDAAWPVASVQVHARPEGRLRSETTLSPRGNDRLRECRTDIRKRPSRFGRLIWSIGRPSASSRSPTSGIGGPNSRVPMRTVAAHRPPEHSSPAPLGSTNSESSHREVPRNVTDRAAADAATATWVCEH